MRPERSQPGTRGSARHLRGTLRPELAGMDWRVIDDGVMGGRSQGRVETGPGGLRFSGELSTANNGGFSSVRAPLPRPRPGLVEVRLRVRGDGRVYQLRLRESAESEAPAWRASFATSDGWQQLRLPAKDFEAVIRGRRLEILPGLRERTIRHVGLMLTSEDAGPFELTVDGLELVYDGAPDD